MAAHFSSWADCVNMIKQRHPQVAETLIMGIRQDPPCFAAVRHCQGLLEGAGLDVPSWRSLADTPPVLEPEADPTEPKRGWQHPGCPMSGRTTPRKTGVLHPGNPHPRPVGFGSADRVAHKPCDSHRPTTIPGVVVQAPLSPAPVVLSHLPMWPPARRVWTPSSSVFEGWGVGLQRFPCGAGG